MTDYRNHWDTPVAKEFREFLYQVETGGLPYPEGLHNLTVEDQKIFLIDVSGIFSSVHEGDRRDFRSLYVTYYKNRAETEGMWLLAGDTFAPEPATDDDLQRILEDYQDKIAAGQGPVIDGEYSETNPARSLPAPE